MIISVVVTLCHLATVSPPGFAGDGGPADLNIHPQKNIVQAGSLKVCHEEVLFEGESSLQACTVAMPGVADWKMKSRFADDGWQISRLRCIPGHYEKKDAI